MTNDQDEIRALERSIDEITECLRYDNKFRHRSLEKQILNNMKTRRGIYEF
jgi:hypothetical protein